MMEAQTRQLRQRQKTADHRPRGAAKPIQVHVTNLVVDGAHGSFTLNWISHYNSRYETPQPEKWSFELQHEHGTWIVCGLYRRPDTAPTSAQPAR
jgi:hypothetical protein